jgi:triosephosphate isomerase (TIM)
MPKETFLGRLILGNQKDSPNSPKTEEEAEKWVQGILPFKPQLIELTGKEMVLCPNVLLALTFKRLFRDNDLPIKVGLQTSGDLPVGSYTGNIAAEDLEQNGIEYCIVGHSERMENGETQDEVIKQAESLLDHKVIPVLCFRELSELKYYIDTSGKIRDSAAAGNMYVAWEDPGIITKDGDYKPIPIERIVEYDPKIREIAGRKVLDMYGASVSPETVRKIIEAGVQGVLIGKASQNPADFAEVSINA